MRDDLYEQCSDHMTEKIPSSAKLGSRPSSSFIRSNSCCVRLWAAITSGVIIRRLSFLSGTFLDYLVDRLAQLGRIHASDVLVNDLTLLVVQVSRRQVTLPPSIDEIDRRLRVRDVEQVRGHRCPHRIEKLRHLVLDLTHVVERHGHKLERAWAVVFIDLHEIGKLVTTRIAKRGPEVNEQRTLALLRDQTLERVRVDRRNDRQRCLWFRRSTQKIGRAHV